jgi:hypothetical protein
MDMGDDQLATTVTLETSDFIASDPQTSNCDSDSDSDSDSDPPSQKMKVLFLYFFN